MTSKSITTGHISSNWAGIWNTLAAFSNTPSSGNEVTNEGTVEGDVYGILSRSSAQDWSSRLRIMGTSRRLASIATGTGGILNLTNYGTLTGDLVLRLRPAFSTRIFIIKRGQIIGSREAWRGRRHLRGLRRQLRCGIRSGRTRQTPGRSGRRYTQRWAGGDIPQCAGVGTIL
jgi:hypothetical protein